MHYFLNQCISQIILVFLCIKFMLLDLFIASADVFKIKKGLCYKPRLTMK